VSAVGERLPRATAGRVGSIDVTISRLGAPLLRARDATTCWQRLRGLHGMLPLGSSRALILRPCRAIQTIGMPHSIDVVFLDREGRILRIETVPPARLCLCPGARVAVEMASGTASRLGLARGHVLSSSAGNWS